ncbi:MAG: C2 domain-containing protein [Planctomycetota bacterium]
MSTPPVQLRARQWRFVVWLALLLIGGAACAWGLWSWTNPVQSDRVSSVRVKTRPGIVNDAAGVKSMLSPGNPDLYVRVIVGGETLQTDTMEDTPVGGGLTWNLDSSLSLAAIERVEVWDEDTFGNDLLDQVTPEGQRVTSGQEYQVILRGPGAKVPTGAIPAALIGGVFALIGGGRLVWEQVV